jgi:modulator of FtsH protease
MDYNQDVRPLDTTQVSGAVRTNKVMRNTYMLLALSMIPTVLGAWLGVATGLSQAMVISPGTTMIVFLVGAFGFMFAIEKNKESGLGVGLLLAFTFFMGIMLSRMIGLVLGLSNGAALIGISFGGTAAIFLSMAALGTVIKRDLSGLGKFLMIGAWLLFFACILMFFVQMPAMFATICVLIIGVFSLFMLYDVNKVIKGGETNYVSATLQLYLDIYNVFQALLALLSIFGGGNRN